MKTNRIIVEVEGLTKSFGKIRAVDNLSFVVYEGDILGFLGPNGAGKTTTLYMLLGLVHPDSGRIRLFGEDLRKDRISLLRWVGAVVESPDFYRHLSARKNLELLNRIHNGRIDSTRIDEVLALVGLEERAGDKVKTYSHGMRQRLGIAQAILHRPRLLILDEPTIGLDPEGSQEVWSILRQLVAREKMTIIISSHLLFEIEEFSNRVCVIDQGKMLTCDFTHKLLQLSQPVVEVEFDSPEERQNASELLAQTHWAEVLNNLTPANLPILQVKLQGKTPKELNKFLFDHGLIASSIRPIHQNLREFFLRITQKDKTTQL
ncbi:ABC transporter ATP-binding protein [Candidatus Sumerlaeota bacterium]|nr:ABC transporter ATP-binding protein [Candidatus Sumerlaeota bacterium]